MKCNQLRKDAINHIIHNIFIITSFGISFTKYYRFNYINDKQCYIDSQDEQIIGTVLLSALLKL